MHKRKAHILALVLMVGFFFGQGQNILGSLSSDSIKIGETTSIRIPAELVQGLSPLSPKGYWLPEIEVLQEGRDTLPNNQAVYTVSFTAFESGDYLLKPLIFLNGKDTVRSPAFRLHVREVLVDTTQARIHPIKPILEERLNFWDYWNKYWIYILMLGIVVLVGLLLLFLYLRSKKPRETQRVLLSPEQEALQALEQLEKESAQANAIENQKSIYSQLVQILKRYVERRMQLPSNELISADLVLMLQQKDKLENEDASQLLDLLNDADGVKFAKFQPKLEKQKKHTDWLRHWIEVSKPVELPPQPENQPFDE